MSDDNAQVKLIPILIISNDPTEFKVDTIEMIYKSISKGQLAYMDGKDAETGEIVPLLVGLEPVSEDRYSIYPLARLLIQDTDLEATYLVPDGNGEYTSTDDNNAVDLGINAADLEPIDGGGEEGEGPAEGLREQTRLH